MRKYHQHPYNWKWAHHTESLWLKWVKDRALKKLSAYDTMNGLTANHVSAKTTYLCNRNTMFRLT